MIDRLKKLTPVHVWLFSIVTSVVMTECIVGGIVMLLKEEASNDYFLIGFVASLFVAGLAGSFLTSFITRQKKIVPDIHAATSTIEAQENMAATGAVMKEDAGKAVLRIATPRIITKQKTVEEQICNDSDLVDLTPALPATPVIAQKPPALKVKDDDAGEITHYAATQPAIPKRKAVEGQISNGSDHAGIRRAINNLDALPAMPVIAQKLLTLNLGTEEGERMLLVLIEQDPQISAKVLGLANSAIVGASRQIKTVRDAAMLLGIKRVQSVAASIAILSLMTKAPSGKLNMQDVLLHSFGIAFAMLGIARVMPAKIRPQDDQIFLGGMLHDIGYLALAFLDSKLSDKLHTRLAAEAGRPALEVEREVLEMCHNEWGAELARHWNLPDEIIAVLRYHHNPDAAGAAAGHPLVRMVNIAEKLLPSFGLNEFVAPDISPEEWEALGIDLSKTEKVKEQVDEQVEQAMQFVSSFT